MPGRPKKFRRRDRAYSGPKRTDFKRRCSSGKKGYKQPGDARAAATFDNPVIYTCESCEEYHLANPVGRKERRRRWEGLAA